MYDRSWELRVITEIHRRILEDRESHNVFVEKKGKRFVWDLKCEESFNKLKELLITTPILKIVDPNKDFVVCTDASNEGLGGVLIVQKVT